MPSRLDDWLNRIEAQHPPRIKLGLERCVAVWSRMGRPAPARNVITVAGTNGKGSTVAALQAMLQSRGNRTGAYSSPHLLRYNERIRIDGQEVEDEAIIAGFEQVDACKMSEPLTYFEFATLAAFASLSSADLDYAVLEVGLGGRLDAVNIVDPDCAVITPIGIDHQDYLGASRELIGAEKAGIMRRGIPVICSDRDPPASAQNAARKMAYPYLQIGRDFDVFHSNGGWHYSFGHVETSLAPGMPGNHQADNLSCALTVALNLLPGANIDVERLARAGAAARVRGRLETLSVQPEIIVDVGHNPLAANVIAGYLGERGSPSVHAVLGMLADKDCEGFVSGLSDEIDAWHCCGLEVERGQSGEALAQRINTLAGRARVSVHSSVSNGLDAAVEQAGSNGLILACGSFLTAAQAISHVEGNLTR